MNEVSIIINGVRYDAVNISDRHHANSCDYCEMTEDDCNQLSNCPLSSARVFKKSTKSFER